ncbi:MAG: DNA polymerase III subunit gamma/tau [Alphaproteobacteria bacterium]|nr:DNA polymerase III subunit gamma/tau [Alphaproteobacteria bacterium]MBR5904056.1 DNA polymerase III subunit gamma/tau [Alphaproteobacteria bacterium]
MENNYTVLARKYRSQDFDSLIGQDVLVKTLTTAINTGRIAHAYIFTGIRGTGKTSTARILAKALNCLSSDKPTAKPCCECENCKSIAAGQHIDVMEIDAASHTGVDNMREILDAALYRPTNARYKVYIIDEVHMLSQSAFNALLKTLEEPPAHVIFILATTEIRKVPVTILSRCQRFDLARVPVETLKKHFAWVADQEKIELSDGANDLLARAADGSVRDGLSLLDQAIAQTGGHVDEGAVLDMLKRTDRGTIVNFMKIVLSGDVNAALNKLDEIYNNGADLTMLLNDMMEWTHWATRMYPSLRLQDATSSPYTADQRETIKQINENITLNTLSRIWQVMTASVSELQASSNQKQCFDMLIIRLMHIADMPSIPELLKQNESQQPTIQKIEPKPEEKKPETLTIKSAQDLSNALQEARELLMFAYFNNNIEIVEFTDGKIKIFDRGNDKEFLPKLSNWLKTTTGKVWDIELMEQSQHQQTNSEHVKEEIQSDPMVASAMNLFDDAEIVNVSDK